MNELKRYSPSWFVATVVVEPPRISCTCTPSSSGSVVCRMPSALLVSRHTIRPSRMRSTMPKSNERSALPNAAGVRPSISYDEPTRVASLSFSSFELPATSTIGVS